MPINQIEHQSVIYQPFYRMNGDAEFFQSPNGNVYHLKQGGFTCAFAKFEMDANGAQKNPTVCKSKPGAKRPCAHTLTPAMQSLLTLWRVTRLSLCRLKWGRRIADFNKNTVKRAFNHFRLISARARYEFRYLVRRTLRQYQVPLKK